MSEYAAGRPWLSVKKVKFKKADAFVPGHESYPEIRYSACGFRIKSGGSA